MTDQESGIESDEYRKVNERLKKRIKIDGSQTRWIVISLVIYFFLAEGFTKTSYGQVNNILARFHDVSIDKVDWLTLAPSASSGVSLFLMTWMTASGLVGLRAWCLTSIGFLTLSFIFAVVAILVRHVFPIAVLGQVLAGTANAINFSLAPLMASSWFPENEQPTAIALTYAGLNAGNIIGFIAPTTMLKANYTKKRIWRNFITDVDVDSSTGWHTHVSCILASIYSSFLTATVIFAFFSFIFIFDTPSPMQLPEVKRVSDDEEYRMRERSRNRRKESAFQIRINKAKTATRSTALAWFQASKSLLTMKKFLVLAVPYSIMMSLCLIWFVLMSDVFRATSFNNVVFLDVSTIKNATSITVRYRGTSNEMAGYVMSMYCVGGLIAGAVTGKIARLFNYNYARMSCVGTWLVAGFSVGLGVGFLLASIEAIFVFMLLFGIFAPVTATSLVALVIECVNTEDQLTVGTWLTIFASVNASLLPLFGRLLLENFGPFSLTVFQSSISIITAFFLIFVQHFLD